MHTIFPPKQVATGKVKLASGRNVIGRFAVNWLAQNHVNSSFNLQMSILQKLSSIKKNVLLRK